MAAQEFYFKSPFEINEEYSILKSILFFSLAPLELILVFAYARIYGSLSNYTWQIITIMVLVNILVSNIFINKMKNDEFVKDTIAHYEQLEYTERKKLYSFKSIAGVVFVSAVLPWLILFAGIFIICLLFPH